MQGGASGSAAKLCNPVRTNPLKGHEQHVLRALLLTSKYKEYSINLRIIYETLAPVLKK